MKQMIPVITNLGRKSILMLFTTLCFAGTTFAQNATNGGAIASSQTICPGETPSELVSVTPASGGDVTADLEYLWMYGFSANFNFVTFNVAPGNNDGESYQPPAVGVTTYFIRCARRAGFTVFNAESNIVAINVASSPTAVINGAESNIYAGTNLNLNATPSANTTYAWDFNGDGFPDCFGANCPYTYNVPGTYVITLTATNQITGCSAITPYTVTVSAPTDSNVSDPCNCGNPNNLFTPTTYYNHDYILINSSPGQSWFFSNTGGTTVYNSALSPIPNGTLIPEVQPGVYYLNVWFEGSAGGWSANASNGQFNLSTGPGAANVCPACDNPLPVELKDFRATVVDNGVMLKWETASEENNSHFEVESSLDGDRFDFVGQVEGAGNSTTEKAYSFFIENPVPGDNYFRLKQVDFDGQNEVSPFVSVRISSDKPIVSVIPNPVKTDATIRLGDVVTPGTKLELISSTGQLVQTIVATSTSETLNMEGLPSGIYFIRIENAPKANQAYYKVIKQ